MVANKGAYALILAVLVLGIVAVPAFSHVGVSITPSSGQYAFKSGGGKMDFIVTNFGDEASVFLVQVSGDAAAFSSIDKTQATIEPGASEKFTVTLAPSSASYGQSYPLAIIARTTSAAGATGDVSANIVVAFSGEAGTKDYTLSEIPSMKSESAISSRLFTFFAAALLIGLAYYLIKTKGPWKE
jgi:hypothetical protein